MGKVNWYRARILYDFDCGHRDRALVIPVFHLSVMWRASKTDWYTSFHFIPTQYCQIYVTNVNLSEQILV